MSILAPLFEKGARLGRWTRALRNPGIRRSRHGYVIGVPVYRLAPLGLVPPPWRCAAPIDPRGRLILTPAWATACFVPAYHRARAAWGPNKKAITTEVMHDLWPWASVRGSRSAAEAELRRRVELAVAALLNAEGTPARYPPPPLWPVGLPSPRTPSWLSALITGAIRG